MEREVVLMKIAPRARVVIRQLITLLFFGCGFVYILSFATVGIYFLDREGGVPAEGIAKINDYLPGWRLKMCCLLGFMLATGSLVLWWIYRSRTWSLTADGVVVDDGSDEREVPWARLERIWMKKGTLMLRSIEPDEQTSLAFVGDRERWAFMLKCEELAAAEAGGCKPPPLG